MKELIPNSNYLIDIPDTRFNEVFELWIRNVFHTLTDKKIDRTHDCPLFTLTNYLEFNLVTSVSKLEVFIPTTIYSTLKMLRSSDMDFAIIAYPAALVPTQDLCVISKHFLSKRRQFDYEIKVLSAFQLSSFVDNFHEDPVRDDHLLDFMIPNLSMLFITFNGSKLQL
jgi:hypothetical protein